MTEIKTLQQAILYFSNEQTCINAVAAMRWTDGKPVCPSCQHQEHYWLGTQKRWKCKECWKQFSVKVGTIFEDSHISLDKWLLAMWMIGSCKNGVSSWEIPPRYWRNSKNRMVSDAPYPACYAPWFVPYQTWWKRERGRSRRNIHWRQGP